MATYTSNYGWAKPSGSDNVDISVLNDNLDDQDSTIHDAFLNMAPPFSESSTYAVDDIVLYGTGLYKCHTAVVTPGSWTGSTNWQVYKLSEGGSGGGGGTTNYNALTNKPQINSVELSGNKTSAQLGLMASDGVVANPTGQTTGTLTALEVDGTKYAVPSGGTSDYTALTNKPSINGVTLSGNKTTSALGINIPTELADLDSDSTHRTVTDTEKATWNGKSDFSGSYSDLSNKPENANTFQGTIAEWNQLTTAEKKAYDHASITGAGGGEYNVDKTTGDLVPTSGMPSEYPATQVMMSDGVTSVEEAVDNVFTATNATGVSGAFHYTKIGRVVVGAGEMTITQNIAAYSPIVTDLPLSETTVMGAFVAQDNGYNTVYINTGSTASNITTRTARNNGELMRLLCVYFAQS